MFSIEYILIGLQGSQDQEGILLYTKSAIQFIQFSHDSV